MKKHYNLYLYRVLFFCLPFMAGMQSSQAQCRTLFMYVPDSTGYAIQFYDSSYMPASSPVSWFWDFGDGNTSNLQNPFHVYNFTGPVAVCLTVAFNGGCTSTYCDTISLGIQNPCMASFSVSQSGTTQYNFINQSNLPSGGNSFFWDFGDSSTSTLSNPSHTFPGPGTYMVCLSVSNSGSGCSDTYCQTVVVPSTGICQAGFGVQVTPNGVVDFSNTSTGSVDISVWDFGDGTFYTTIGTAMTSHTYAAPGIYVVCLTIMDTLNNCNDTWCDSVLINSSVACLSSFTYQADSTGSMVYFMNTSTGTSLSYSWDFGDGNSSTLINPVHTYSNPGTYVACLTVDDGRGCTNTSCQTILAVHPCTPVFVALPDSSNPAGGPVMVLYILQNCGQPNAIFWDFGDGSYDSTGTFVLTHEFDSTGWYDVCAYVVMGVDTFSFCDSVFAYRLSVGIDTEAQWQSALEVYPNPFHQTFTIRNTAGNFGDVRIRLFDLSGRVLRDLSFDQLAAETSIPVSDLAAGTYLLNIESSGATRIVKLLKME